MTDLARPRSGVPSRRWRSAGQPALAMMKQAMAQAFSWNKAATAMELYMPADPMRAPVGDTRSRSAGPR